jgi:hypothetical protein
MLDDQFTLPAAMALKPLTQGSLSNLCGLYSTLNAIQLVLYPQRLRRKQLQNLYLHGVSHLSRSKRLKSSLSFGMEQAAWLRLATTLIERANDDHGTSIVIKQVLDGSPRTSRVRALRRICATISSGSPVVVGMGGAHWHYTVLVGFTELRLLLFDSSGLRWIEAAGVGLGGGSTKRHRLFADSVSAFVDDW